ncbi:hypothetical protein DFR72_10894 [Lentzea flaviverrucosa]|uniref:Uncharacterized protein n=1 Tax=Lentzea flaviverrucosa TaxID=200379 RepID=A0A1H9SJQ0_9PSEU|nr:hypothetical protein DFR72_10894 [Lentzea flaviverrucosa]SER85177.1 hypothetical protein SAMN05216195_10795 [Lentzea flaviverrucosa]
MSNQVLLAGLRRNLDEHLERVSRVAVDGDAGAALTVMRQDVPGIVAALRVLAEEHRADEDGHCQKCRSGPFWRRVAAPCRMLLDVHLAVTVAATTARACASPQSHGLRSSTSD